MSRRPGARAVLGLGLLAGLWASGCGGTTAPPKKDAVPPVVTVARPVNDEVADYEDFTGRTDAVFAVEIRARVSGFLDKVDFKDGDDVKEGDLLFEIDNRPYKANLNRTEATLAQAEAHLKRLDADYRRVANLYSRGNASREEFDKVTGDRAEADSAVGVARADFEMAKLNMAFTRITAPISGRLGRRLVDPGNLVQADTTPLTTVVSLDPLFVYFDVDERTLLKIRRLIAEKKMKSREEADIEVLVALSDEFELRPQGDHQLQRQPGRRRDRHPPRPGLDRQPQAPAPLAGPLRPRPRPDRPPAQVDHDRREGPSAPTKARNSSTSSTTSIKR